MPKPLAWLIIAVFAAVWAWLVTNAWREGGWPAVATDAALFIAATTIMFAALALWRAGIEHHRRRLAAALPPSIRSRTADESAGDGTTRVPIPVDPAPRPNHLSTRVDL